LAILEGLTFGGVETRLLTVPPLVVNGKVYIIPPAATSIWSPYVNYFAIAVNGTWIYIQPYEGTIVYCNDTEIQALWNGTNWVDYPSGGITTINTLTDLVQTFTTTTNGTDFGITSAAGNHAFNLPLASATSTGKLSSTDWQDFDAKQDALSGTGIVASTAGTISYITDNSTNWNTAYDNRIASFTTTGSGAATFVANVLNIPVNGFAPTGTNLQYIAGDGSLATFPAIPTTENIQDIIASTLVEGTDIDLFYNDSAGTLTISATNSGDDGTSGLYEWNNFT
jgi:hypothetical protein